MSPQSRMYRRGSSRDRAFLDEISARPGGAHLTYAEVRELAHGRRTVRVLFDHETGLARADELCGTVIIEPVTDGRWEDLNDVEITARLYSWARELPVSRIDAP